MHEIGPLLVFFATTIVRVGFWLVRGSLDEQGMHAAAVPAGVSVAFALFESWTNE